MCSYKLFENNLQVYRAVDFDNWPDADAIPAFFDFGKLSK